MGECERRSMSEVFYWFVAFCCLGGLKYISYQVGRWVQWNDDEHVAKALRELITGAA